jgi:hypothetical protein
VKGRWNKITSLLLVVLFVQAMLLGSVCVSNKDYSGCKGEVLLALDVCGHGGPAGVITSADLDAVVPATLSFYAIKKVSFPPTPAEAVASAEPGETGKPPEPSLS